LPPCVFIHEVTDATGVERMTLERDRRIAEIVGREQTRLRRFIRSRVRDSRDAEDVVQDVLTALVEANQLLMPIEHVTGWLFRVARNRITDLFRRKKPDPLVLEDLLPSSEAGPDAIYERHALLDAFEEALAELPPEQREVFVQHELEGRSFKEIASATGVNVSTLLSRKHYAVLHLRERLRDVYEEFTR